MIDITHKNKNIKTFLNLFLRKKTFQGDDMVNRIEL